MASTVVVGFIDSPEGRAAVEAAVIEAERRTATVVLVNSSHGGRHEHAEDVVAERDSIEATRAELAGRGVDVVVEEFARGNDPAQDLLDVAEARNAELIVIGLRRRSPVGKLILGSNSQSILLQAECPVLAVKAQHSS